MCSKSSFSINGFATSFIYPLRNTIKISPESKHLGHESNKLHNSININYKTSIAKNKWFKKNKK